MQYIENIPEKKLDKLYLNDMDILKTNNSPAQPLNKQTMTYSA